MGSRRVRGIISLLQFLKQNVRHILVNDVLSLANVNDNKLLEGREIIIIVHDLDLCILVQTSVVLGKGSVEGRQMVFQDELAKVIKADAPDHNNRRATSVMSEANFPFLHEISLRDVGDRID